ncbi:MAG: signal peptidase I [Promethearchaeota archaeon]
MSKPEKKTGSEKKKHMKNQGIKTLIVIGIVTIVTFGGFFLLRVFLGTDLPLVVVTSESMAPGIKTGHLLFVMGKNPADIKNGTHEGKDGDIIIYDSYPFWHSDPSYDPIVHRVIGKWYNETEEKWYFKAQGDANSSPDPPHSVDYPIPEDNILGVVIGGIPWIGYIKIWLTETGLAIPLIVILALLLVISIVYDITHPEKKDEETDNKERKPEEFNEENADMGI